MNSPRQKSERTLGILCILCAAFCFSLMSLFVRLAGNIPTMQKIFFRNLVAAIAAFVILAREGQGFRIHKGCLGGHLARSITGMLGMVANFWAIDHIGMADANMLNKLSPFFAILFSIFLQRLSARYSSSVPRRALRVFPRSPACWAASARAPRTRSSGR